MTIPASIAMIGFGEVGQIFAEDLKAAGVSSIRAFDIAFADASSGPARAARRLGVTAAASTAEAVSGAELVISAVTAAATGEAAAAVAGAGIGAAFFLDLNSASPATKQEASALIARVGGRYVEAAVMASVPPKRLRTPMLLGGPHAAAFMDVAVALGLDAAPYSDEVGVASSVKMCRSIMIKGMEALAMECLATARHYGVEGPVLASLRDTFPNHDWEETARYMIGRSLQHGRRRAEEMREVARTVEDAGIAPDMTAGAVRRQEWAAGIGRRLDGGWKDLGLAALLDRIRAAADHRADREGRD
ncbi:NAD(P)-dependent oxidoreductase [Arenibaculum pallidiluteum]|uniref:NAD(P)-dependent oxidoreductase n=1 Tax=Arenibaculum pallidiluteum TaxID=2812559 RepID=UPI001B3B78D0|nr:DUF1932 domain-containing protein [Arenibaculum pallidiluteum]